ncbi:hypothetical protein [Streptomyces sp. NPDC001594]
MERAHVYVHASDGTKHKFDKQRLAGKNDQRRDWLGDYYSKQIHLRRVQA